MQSLSLYISPRRICKTAAAVLCLFMLFSQVARAETTFRVWGDMDIGFNMLDNTLFDTESDADALIVNQRLRLFMSARVAENLQGVAMFRFLPASWGRSKVGNADGGYALDGDGVILRNRFLYLDWQPLSVPVQIRMGLQPLALPFAAFRNGVLDSSAGGITMTYDLTSQISATTFWARPYDEYDNDSNVNSQNKLDEMDLFYFALPMNFAPQGVKVVPWTMYSHIGKDSGYWRTKSSSATKAGNRWGNDPKAPAFDSNSDGNSWWAGVAATFTTFDPLTVKFDFTYGALNTDHEDFALGNNVVNTRGWFSALALDYKLDWAVPGVFAWYGSGSDADDVRDKSQWGYLPYVSTFGEGFGATSFGFAGHYHLNAGAVSSFSASGRWGVGAQLDQIAIWPMLRHTVRVAYYRGTNDPDLVKDGIDLTPNGVSTAIAGPGAIDRQMMTTKDSAVEFNFNHYYKIYENLEVGMNTGYIRMDRDKIWDDRYRDDRNAWQLSTDFHYTF